MHNPQDSDEILLRLIAERDVAALETLYDRHAQTIYNLILRIVREPTLAEEVLQDTFWQTWQKAAEFQASGAATAWLYRIARNKSLDMLRRQKARPQPISTTLTGDDAEGLATLATSAPSVESGVEQAWKRRLVRLALGTIPSEQRQCLELAYFEGLSQREIAAYMATPLGTVKTRMRIGLEKMERILRTAGLDAEDVES